VNKLGAVLIVIALVAVCYLILLVVMPTVTGIVETANTTLSTHDLTNYPGASEGLVATPWILWFVPAVIGMIVVVLIVRRT